MAATVRIPVVANEWTLIAEGPLTDCLVTATRDCFFVYADATPEFDSGHSIKAFESVNAVPEDGVDFYMLSPSDECLVYKTERAA